MRTYIRSKVPGAVYFFTVNLAERYDNPLLVKHVSNLREAFRKTRRTHPFTVEAVVILPDHLHCLWRMPENDFNFSTRWRLIKAHFSRSLPVGEAISASRGRKGERGIWQRRLWEHTIRDETDFARHMDYIHYNPVKHGHVMAVGEWPHSSFHRCVERGLYQPDWAVGEDIRELEFE